MGNISDYLKQILSARYGKDVRQSIHDSIAEINNIATGARDSATASASAASASATSAANSAVAAATSEVNAKASEDAAKQAAQTAQEVTNITYASEERAGIVKPKDVYVNQKDGTMEFTARTNTGILEHSHAGGIRLHRISAVEDRQDSTTGEQLFDADSVTKEQINSSTGEITTNTTWRLSDYIPCTAAADYCVAQSTSVYFQFRIAFYDAGKTFISTLNKEATNIKSWAFTTVENAAYMRVSYSTWVSGETVDRGNIMLNVGGTVLPWEPYTGGKPSPAPGEAVVVSTNQLKLNGTSQTVNGVTSSPDTYNQMPYIYGEATADATFVIGTAKLEAGTYYASCTPSSLLDDMNTAYEYTVRDANSNVLVNKSTVTSQNVEEEFTLTEAQTVTVEFTVPQAEVIDCEFTVMIATTSGATWDKYAVEYTEGYPQPIEGTVMKNLLDCSGLVGKTSNGITFTPVYDENGYLQYIEVNGATTDTGGAVYNLANTLALGNGKYIMSGCPSGGKDSYVMQYNFAQVDTGSGTIISGCDNGVNVRIYIYPGFTATNLKFYPMIRPASILDDTYVPYGCMRVVGVDENGNIQSTILSKQFADFHNIGGVSDALTPNAEIRRIATKPFGGTWQLRDFHASDESNVFSASEYITDNAYKSNLKMLCSHLQYGGTVLKRQNIEAIGVNGFFYKYVNTTAETKGTSVYICTSSASTPEELAVLLADAEFVYELAEPECTDLPTADQIALHSLKSYDGVTHLYTDTYPPMVIDCEWGTSRAGAVAFEGYNTGRRAEIRAEANYNELAAALLALNQE